MWKSRKSIHDVSILGVNISDITVDILNNKIKNDVDNNRSSIILHGNVYGLNLAYENRWLREFYNSAEVVFCDGAGVILGAKPMCPFGP